MSSVAEADAGNVSLASLKFLARFFAAETFTIARVWGAFATVMSEANATITYFRDYSWEQDWFLAKYATEDPALGIISQYLPPVDFTAFPMFDLDARIEGLLAIPGLAVTRSRAKVQVLSLFEQPAQGPATLKDGMNEFDELRKRIQAHRDPAMTELNHVLAWVHLALGYLFSGIALTPVEGDNVDPHLQWCARRWSLIWNEHDWDETHMPLPELIQWKLDVFYGAEIRKDGKGIAMHPSRQGQPLQWREHWNWLSVDVDPELAVAAVQLAARLIISIPVCLFLQAKLREAEERVTTGHLMAIVILRRWILQLQTMMWLETALKHSWQDIRPQDLVTFAFSALRPHWPRRLFGLSHRSMDVKSALSTTVAWHNFRYSIDATFVPHWETNVSTVWGLFSTTPALIRVPSEHYEKSDWCRRERELFEYLKQDDFLDGRYLIELPQPQVASLDAALPAQATAEGSPLFKIGGFPRLTSVFRLFPYEPWEAKLLACAAAVRILFLRLLDRDLTRTACLRLALGSVPPSGFPPLTNHPDGWSSVMRLLADFHRDWADNIDTFPLAMLVEKYTPEELQRELDYEDTITDLSDGSIDQPAVLAAFEWNRTIVPALIGNHKYGSFFMVDFREFTYQQWAQEEAFMVIRGANRIRTSIPLWFLQHDQQRVDEWPAIGQNPVLTKHVPKQWDWMQWEILLAPQWPADIQVWSGLQFSEKLASACAATKQRGREYYQGKGVKIS
jgi:hypothetical protein